MAVGDFWIDPKMTTTNWVGRGAPAGHHRRCQSKKKDGSGDQCGQWALKWSNYCKYHGGLRTKVWVDRQGTKLNRYALQGKAKLKEILSMFEGPLEDQVKLYDEIQVARVICERAIRIFEATCINYDSLDEEQQKKISPEMKARASSFAQSSLNHVSALVEKQAKLIALREDTFTADQMEFLVHRISGIMSDHLEEQPDVLNLILQEIGKLRPPSKNSVQITIT